ncbi:hypothetical protein [Streptomyces cahuitamycinicus]|uniref:Phosphoesterase n=1 Tax=Streptomyces cahuitamycinicus TaxID=2070367 RepID=A0A2N8TIF8_9ACTN|nr:hypothetical protein C1J00_29100 [Streptomyces cahuitamycinicus]
MSTPSGYPHGMTPHDPNLTVPKPGHRPLRARALTPDRRLLEAAAGRHRPGADPVLSRLGRGANHGVLWFAAAVGLAVSRTPRARRAAARGLASLGVASLTVGVLGKRSVSRPARSGTRSR